MTATCSKAAFILTEAPQHTLAFTATRRPHGHKGGLALVNAPPTTNGCSLWRRANPTSSRHRKNICDEQRNIVTISRSSCCSSLPVMYLLFIFNVSNRELRLHRPLGSVWCLSASVCRADLTHWKAPCGLILSPHVDGRVVLCPSSVSEEDQKLWIFSKNSPSGNTVLLCCHLRNRSPAHQVFCLLGIANQR